MKKREKVLKIFSALILAIFICFVIKVFYKFVICSTTSSNITSLISYEPIQVFIFGNSEDSVSASISLFNIDGEQIAQIERSWNSGSISIDFLTVTFAKKSISFPLRIYGNYKSNANSGTKLQRYYLKDKKCLLFSTRKNSISQKEQEALFNFASFAFSPSAQIFSSVLKTQTVNLSYCIPGKTYSIRAESNGNLFLYKLTD